jgi:hypothetical protein
MKNGIKNIVIAMLCVAMVIPQIALGQTAASQSPLTNQSSIQFLPEGGSASFGFTIGGTAPRKILIRVVGPGLAQLGVAGTMPNPRCEIFRAVNGNVAQVFNNDNWENQTLTPSGNIVLARAPAADLPALMASVGAFGPLSPNDAAVVLTLAAGSYTVRASSSVSAQVTSGNVLIEVYLVE